ncbi:uncharacterized protein LOC117291661 [Asterias rubens]|uniref:uncharacterized protein LOC117291661 n=1 Tax=Asterias rubens TaxID=7604 RepID=UPI001455B613|nr:uncharacterized protein LOC117291661 [Asterias rubens]
MHMKSRHSAGNTSSEKKPKWFEDALNTHEHQAKYLDKILTMKESLARDEQQQQQQQQPGGGSRTTRYRQGRRDSGNSEPSSASTGSTFSHSQAPSNSGFPKRGAKTKSREMGKVRSPPEMYPIDVVQGRAMFDKAAGETGRDKPARWWRSGSLDEKHVIKRSSKDMPKILPPMATIPALERRSGHCDKIKGYTSSCTGSKVNREETERDKMIDLKMPVKKSAKAMSHVKGSNKASGKLCKSRSTERPLRRTQSLDFRCELAPVHHPITMETGAPVESNQQGRGRNATGPGTTDQPNSTAPTGGHSLTELMDKMDVLEGAVGGSADTMEYSDAATVTIATQDEPMPEDDLTNCADTAEDGEPGESDENRFDTFCSLLEIPNPCLGKQRRHTLPVINLRPPTPRLNDREEEKVDKHIGRILRKVVCQSVIRKKELTRLCEDIEEFNEINSVLSDNIQR